jgi:hypothetical protein
MTRWTFPLKIIINNDETGETQRMYLGDLDGSLSGNGTGNENGSSTGTRMGGDSASQAETGGEQ